MTGQQSDVNHWVCVVRGEYLDMPGLRLTTPQVQRLWGLDSQTCDVVLSTLEHDHFLLRTPKNAYVRADMV